LAIGNPFGQYFMSIAPIYEDLLNRDPRWALSEGSRHFEEDSAVFQALHGIAGRLKSLGIPYAVIGGMALFRHGLRRFTEDVDILVTKDDLKTIHTKLEGLGYLPPFAKSKHLRDTRLGVRIEFLTSGEFPGDGKPKPVSFPNPAEVSFEAEGISYVTLPRLVELKLASGMTNASRLKDLADVMELIKIRDLPRELVQDLNPFVAEKYLELWSQAKPRFIRVWRDPRLDASVRSIDDVIRVLPEMASEFTTLRDLGAQLDLDNGVDGAIRLWLHDEDEAQSHGFVNESDYWDDADA
jgi:hypothetical protein